MTKLLVMLLEDALVEFTYNATIAGMMYFIQATTRGIDVSHWLLWYQCTDLLCGYSR